MEDNTLYAHGHHCMHCGVRMYEDSVSYPVGREYDWVVIDGVTYKRVDDKPLGYVTPEDGMRRTVR